MSLAISTPNDQYSKSADSVQLVRDTVEGEPTIKSGSNKEKYLPNPCPGEEGSEEIYDRFLAGAEYDSIPASTVNSLLGVMYTPEPEIVLPPKMEYLLEDADGNGLPLKNQMKVASSEILQVNYIGLLAEYNDLSNLNVDEITIADAQSMNLQSSIKQYVRESIINWGFSKVNGRLQLQYVVLAETDEVTNFDTLESDKVNSYLLLALDEDGFYYQKKFVENSPTNHTESEPLYPKAGGNNLREIPFAFVMQDDKPVGSIPVEPGYIYPISTKTLARYRVSANLKEALYNMGGPISYSTGWTEQGLKTFEKLTGRTNISVSPYAHNPLPKDATFEIAKWDTEGSAYFTYMKDNAAEIRALGGVFDNTDGNDPETATAAAIKAADKKGVLSSVADNTEQGFERVIQWCMLFESTSGDVDISINRDYSKVKLTPQEQKAIHDNYLSNIYSREEALRQLEHGGVLRSEAETILQELAQEV